MSSNAPDQSAARARASFGGEDCLTGSQQCDTPDQSAARNITLSLRSRRENKSGMREVKERRKEMRVALEIRTSLRPERPGTTPEGEARSKQKGKERGGARALTTRTSLRPEESEAGKKGTASKERTGEIVRRETGKGHETPKHRGSKEREERTTKEKGVTTKSIFFPSNAFMAFARSFTTLYDIA